MIPDTGGFFLFQNCCLSFTGSQTSGEVFRQIFTIPSQAATLGA